MRYHVVFRRARPLRRPGDDELLCWVNDLKSALFIRDACNAYLVSDDGAYVVLDCFSLDRREVTTAE